MARGVPFIVSVHCLGAEDLMKNKVLSALVRENLAETVIFLDDVPFPTHIKEVLML